MFNKTYFGGSTGRDSFFSSRARREDLALFLIDSINDCCELLELDRVVVDRIDVASDEDGDNENSELRELELD